MHDDYYTGERPEMRRLLPQSVERMLELGCGSGDFSARVKQERGTECWAIEYAPNAAAKAATVLDHVLVGDADSLIGDLPDNYFDVIACNDVLEHLVDPTRLLQRLRPKLAAGGVVVASIPNIRFLPALARIVFLRDFPQEDEGIFDRTHLRWYTKKSMRRMFDDAGYDVRTMKGLHACSPIAVALGILSFGFFWDGVWLQYGCVAQPR